MLSEMLRLPVIDAVGTSARAYDLIIDLASGDYPSVVGLVTDGPNLIQRVHPWTRVHLAGSHLGTSESTTWMQAKRSMRRCWMTPSYLNVMSWIRRFSIL